MLCLGIEGTAHTVGIGIVGSDCDILANVYKIFSPPKGGIHPREAANHHAKYIVLLIKEAIQKSKIRYEDIDLIAFSQGPGLGPCLRTIATAARALSLSLSIPIIGVNHCIAHLEIGSKTTNCKDPILLYVSGGNTQVIAFARGKYRVFGETLDVGIGNLFDKLGRETGMTFPAGPQIEQKALEGRKLLDLPYSVKGMDVSFSGMLTAALNLYKRGYPLEDICYSLQEISFAMLTEVTERAMAHVNKNEVLLGGGVARNKRLQKMIEVMASERGAKSYFPRDDLCIDNGAMIAWTGILMHESGMKMKLQDTIINQRFRTDEVEVKWR